MSILYKFASQLKREMLKFSGDETDVISMLVPFVKKSAFEVSRSTIESNSLLLILKKRDASTHNELMHLGEEMTNFPNDSSFHRKWLELETNSKCVVWCVHGIGI